MDHTHVLSNDHTFSYLLVRKQTVINYIIYKSYGGALYVCVWSVCVWSVCVCALIQVQGIF